MNYEIEILDNFETDEALINLISQCPILWNSHHPEFRNENLKSDAWVSVAEAMNGEVDNVKRDWVRLRNRWSREMKKSRNSSHCDGKHLNRWPHFQSLMFLKSFVKPRKEKKYVCSDQAFINLIRQRPILWNSNLHEYRNEPLKNNSWSEIADIMNCDVASIKREWLQLRTRLSRELKRGKQNTASECISQSSIDLLQSLSFLRPFVKPRRILPKTYRKLSFSVPSPGSDAGNVEWKTEIINRLDNSFTQTETSSDNPGYFDTKSDSDKLETAIIESLKSFSNLPLPPKPTTNELFGMTMASMLEKISPTKQAKLQLKIFLMCTEAATEAEKNK